jgi:4-hydroxy-tetrahydrodipicolinate synthase
MARLADVEGVVGVKEATGDLHQISQAMARCAEGFKVLSGNDADTLPILAIGGHGVISTTANVAPREMVEMVRAFRSGDLDRARALHYRLLPLIDALFCETNPIPLKAAMALRGLTTDEIRLPLTPLSEQNRELLQVTLKEFGLL